jgi:hypothetical protein
MGPTGGLSAGRLAAPRPLRTTGRAGASRGTLSCVDGADIPQLLVDAARDGVRRVGPLAVPTRWFEDEHAYRTDVRAVADALLANAPADDAPLYVPKAAAELDHLLALWPHVLVLPTTQPLSIDDLVVARAWPVHPLGVTLANTWADGRVCSPADMFFHDVDHARFKVREDLLARGVSLPDAYVDGTTFDAALGAHRTILDTARAHVDDDGWRNGSARSSCVERWLAAAHQHPVRSMGTAARWLLFEMLHEKSLPIDTTVLGDALAGSAHVDKLRHKCATGFFGAHAPPAAAIDALDDACAWLASMIAEETA